jgi:glutathione synthase/RimK-type ligase-like ATP-grasp enzyme
MKKIGLLSGQENSFPQALIDRINEKEVDGVTAEFVSIDKVIQGTPADYAVILDRISQHVPFYRTWLKQASLDGTAVINNPFWWSADDKFVNNELAHRTGVQVPKTALLPTRSLPENTSDKSFHNLVYPFDWDAIFEHIGFPAYLKPYNGGGWKNVYKIHSREEFFAQHARTGQLVMMLQEEIAYESYYRCYCIGGKYVRVIPYDPYQPENQRYLQEDNGDKAIHSAISQQVAMLNQYLGYDFNAVEIAVKGGVPYVIDFWNPSPEADAHTIGTNNFEWVIETMATYLIERAGKQVPGTDNLTWGTFLQQAIHGRQTAIVPGATKVSAKKPDVPAKKPAAAVKPKAEKAVKASKEEAPKKAPAKKTKKKE